jgi:S-DNA-T family DNA segregation ATPase FtsK/SpoIIIE
MISIIDPFAAAVGGQAAVLGLGYAAAARYGVHMPYWSETDPAVRANLRRAAAIRRNWPQLANSLHLVHRDKNPTLGERLGGHTEAPKPRIRVPRIMKVSADPYGVTVVVRTVRGVGRKKFSDAAQDMADEWRVRKVQCTDLDEDPEWGPGFVKIRAVYNDALRLTQEQPVPERMHDLTRLELGLNTYGEPEYLPLAQGATITVTGASGFGKSMFARNVVVKLAPSREVLLVGANGKATTSMRGDYRVLAPRYSHLVGGDPFEVNVLLRGLQDEMYRRLDCMYDMWGVDEFWDHGPTEELPVILGTFDECQTYLTGGAKGSEKAEIIADNAERAEDLTKKARAAGMLFFWLTQKGTGDAIPTAIRDVATSALTFPVRSRAQEVAALGEEIRDYPEMSPRKILRHAYRGVGTILNDGAEGFTQFKVPFTPPRLAEAVCTATAAYARDVPGITIGREHRMSAPADLSGLLGGRPADEGTVREIRPSDKRSGDKPPLGRKPQFRGKPTSGKRRGGQPGRGTA